MLRLKATIDATEVRLARKRGKLRVANQQGKTGILIDAHIAVLVRRLDRLRALRAGLLFDQKHEA